MSTRRETAFTLIELMIVIALLAIIMAVAIPNFLRGKMSANEAAAVSAMRTIATVSEQYKTRFQSYPSILGDLSTAGYIDTNLGGGVKGDYVYGYAGTADTYQATADPQTPGRSGERYFFVDTSGVIRWSSSGTASAADPPVGSWTP